MAADPYATGLSMSAIAFVPPQRQIALPTPEPAVAALSPAARADAISTELQQSPVAERAGTAVRIGERLSDSDLGRLGDSPEGRDALGALRDALTPAVDTREGAARQLARLGDDERDTGAAGPIAAGFASEGLLQRAGDAVVAGARAIGGVLVDAARGLTGANDDAPDIDTVHESAETGETIDGRTVYAFDDIDTFSIAGNAARPDSVYTFNDFAWTTDAEGRVASSEGLVSLEPVGRNDPSLQTAIGHEGYDTDVGFHIIADSLGGPTNRLNVVPGNGKPLADGTKNLNTGDYAHKFEGAIRDLKRENPDLDVEMRVETVYDAGNDTNRPDVFIASYRVEGGKWIEFEFANIH